MVNVNGQAQRTLMTAEDRQAARALAACVFPAASFNKRFAADLAAIARSGAPDISEKQRRNLWRLVWMYRRQIKDKALLDQARPVWEEWQREVRAMRAERERAAVEAETGKALKDYWT